MTLAKGTVASGLRRGVAAVNAVLRVVLATSFTAMIVLIAMEVFLRNWQGASLGWYDEVGRLLLVWATFLGAAAAVRDRSHYAVDFFEARLSTKFRSLADLIGDAVVTLVGLVFAIQGASLLQLESEQHFAVTGLSLVWQDMALVVGSALIVMFAVRHLAARWIGPSPPVE